MTGSNGFCICVAGNTTNFATHLKREHSSIYEAKDVTQKKQVKINSLLKSEGGSIPMPKNQTNKLTNAVIDFIIDTLQPLSIVDQPSFRQMIACMEPRYSVPCRKTIMTQMKQRHELLKAEILREVNDNSIGITHDSWTSLNTESYDTVTASYISDDWKLKCCVLETTKVEGPHTAENIASTLTDIKLRWKFGEQVITTDNAANEIKAVKLLDWERLSCMGHNLNLIVKAGLKEVSGLVAKGRSLVAFFHHSSSASAMLQEKQKLLLAKEFHGHKLINDCPTKWNSTLEMMQRLTEQTAALHGVATDESGRYSDLKYKLLEFKEQLVVEEIVALLQPFKVATELISSETNPTI